MAAALDDFAALWEAMTPANRYRLVHVLVREVLVDEPSGNVTATLIDFGAPSEVAAEEPPTEAPPPTPRPGLRLIQPTEVSP